MQDKELLNDLIERVTLITSHEQVYEQILNEILCIDIEQYKEITSSKTAELLLLLKLLNDKSVFMVSDMCKTIYSPQFFFKHTLFSYELLYNLVAFFDKELLSLYRITSICEKVYDSDLNTLTLDNLCITDLLDELDSSQTAKSEWEQLEQEML